VVGACGDDAGGTGRAAAKDFAGGRDVGGVVGVGGTGTLGGASIGLCPDTGATSGGMRPSTRAYAAKSGKKLRDAGETQVDITPVEGPAGCRGPRPSRLFCSGPRWQGWYGFIGPGPVPESDVVCWFVWLRNAQ
jgi:hypothetical protein